MYAFSDVLCCLLRHVKVVRYRSGSTRSRLKCKLDQSCQMGLKARLKIRCCSLETGARRFSGKKYQAFSPIAQRLLDALLEG